MSFDAVSKSIFITNIFAAAHPEEHVRLWKQFEQEIPASNRSGVYGADNIAYVRWLKTQKNPTVLEFLNNDVRQRSF